MYLYLSNAPRTLYLITDHQEEKQGKPRRALVFRAAEGNSQAIVEFLRAEEVDVLNLVRLSNRIVKGCLGLISVEGGASPTMLLFGHRPTGLQRYSWPL